MGRPLRVSAPQPVARTPENQDAYPIYPCQDGYVRLCVMSPRQWHGLRRWLGEPEEFQDPKYDVIAARFAAWPQIGVLVAAVVRRPDHESVGTRRAGARRADRRRAVAGADLGVGPFPGGRRRRRRRARARGARRRPAGHFAVDGQHAGFRAPAPPVGRDEAYWLADRSAISAPREIRPRPFDGLRIIDLGIIVAGGELSRLFGDLGAEVIKVESASDPDGLRQARIGDP